MNFVTGNRKTSERIGRREGDVPETEGGGGRAPGDLRD